MDNQRQQPQASRAQKIVAGVLTVLFLTTVVGFGLYGILSNPSAVYNSVRFHKAKSFLADPEDTSFFPMTRARIASLEHNLSNTLPFREELGAINASFHYAIGKDLVTEGDKQMLRLENDQLYYITNYDTLARQAQEIIDFYNYIDGEIPFLFSFVTPGFFEGGLELPAGYDTLDKGEEMADEILAMVREAGIEALDSRTFFKDTGLGNDELQLKTDKHWTTLAALLASQIYAEEINRLTGAELDVSRLALDQFDTEVLEDLFFGSSGQRIGLINSQPEDITLYTPKYETKMRRHSEYRDGNVEDFEGTFEEAMIRHNTLELAEGKTYSEAAYTAYGLIEAFEQDENLSGDCEDLTILVLRDSYTTAICRFLSLLTDNVVSADLRYSELSGVELIEKYQPDMVIVSFSRYLMEGYDYNLGTPEET